MKTFTKSSQKSAKINSKHKVARLFDQDFVYDEKNPDLVNNQFLKCHERIIWFSYRNNFPLIRDVSNENQSASNDFGWGCMIRCSQMLLAEALKRHFQIEKEFIFDSNSWYEEKIFFSGILKLFLDSPSEIQDCLNEKNESEGEHHECVSNQYSLFGIQNICSSAIIRQYKQNVKNWYTSIQACVVLQEILEESQNLLGTKIGFHIVNFTDHIIFLKELTNATKKNNNQPNNILIIIHMKFGASKFEMQYKEYLFGLMRMNNFVGALTGTETKGMYIVGYQEDRLIVLDPHFIQESTDGESGLEKDYQTYFNKSPRSLALECFSSDISLGYFIDINQKAQIDRFIDDIYCLNDHSEDRLLSILEDRVEVDEMDLEGNHESPKLDKKENNEIKKEDIGNQNYLEEEEESKQQEKPQVPLQKVEEKIEPINEGNINNNNNNHLQPFQNSDYYISNGSTLSENLLNSNLEKSNNELEHANFAIPLIERLSRQNQLDNHLSVSNKEYKNDNTNKMQKNIVHNDFEVIS